VAGDGRPDRIHWMTWAQPFLWVPLLAVGLWYEPNVYVAAFAGYGLAIATDRLFYAIDRQAGIRAASEFREAWDAEMARIKARERSEP
jgi:hypothetical protein